MTEDIELADVTATAQEIMRRVAASPTHVRPWLRGIEAETERIVIEIDGVRNRASRRFLTWALGGRDQR